MKQFILLSCLIISTQTAPIVLQSIVETGISKNSFLCPKDASSSAIACSNANDEYAGFDFEKQDTLQIFNNQAYFLHKKAVAEQYALQVLSYSPTEIATYMQNQGWVAMGSYLVLITTNTSATTAIEPEKIAKKNEIKVVAQLYYTGKTRLELWDQAIAIVPTQAQIQITLSSSPSSNAQLTTTTSRTNLLEALKFGEINRDQTTYDAAKNSPRSITISVVG